MIVDAALLQAIASQLGEAVLDPGLWPRLMEDICRVVEVTGAVLLQSDIRTVDVPRTESVKELIEAYFRNGLHLEDVRAMRSAPLMASGQAVVVDQDIFASERDMMRDPIYAFVERFGMRWWAAVSFRSGSAPWGLCLQRTPREGPFDAGDTAVLAKLAPQLTEAATLSKAVGRQVLSGVTNALDRMRFAAIALDHRGLVIETNSLAEAIFDADFRIRNRRVFVRDAIARATLSAFVDQMSASSDKDALTVSPITVRRAMKRPVIIRVLPVSGAARSPFLGARAILTLTDLEQSSRAQPDLMAGAFDLTPAEARLAALLVNGMSLDNAAGLLNVAYETTRSQLRVIFAKTGTSRQGELIALLSRL